MRRFEKDIPYPNVIYKFAKINEFLFQLLTNNELWFSNPQDFNDPYDCNLGFTTRTYTEEEIRKFWNEVDGDVSKETREQRIRQWLSDQSLIEKFFFKPTRDLIQKKALTCFTTRNDSILMWSHYADSHRGICIGYSSELMVKTFYQHEWVTYAKEIPPVNIMIPSEFASTIMCIKSDCWEYEDEIRFFQKGKGFYIFPKAAIKKVIFGLNASVKQIQSVMNLIHKLGYTGIEYHQVAIRNNEFKIYFADLKYEPKSHSVIRAGLNGDSSKFNLSVLNPYWETEKINNQTATRTIGKIP
jgi:hypothetical protein